MREIKRVFGGFFERKRQPSPQIRNLELFKLYNGFPSLDPKVATAVIRGASGDIAIGIHAGGLEKLGSSPSLVDIALRDLERRLAPRGRRAKSEPLERLLEKLDNRLPHSKLTETGRRVGREEFILDFENGIDKSNPASWRSSWLVDEDPNSGGVFDSRRIRELEFRGFLKYAHSFQQLLMLQILINEGKIPNISPDAKSEIDRKVRKVEDTLNQWGEECKAKYHQDPANFMLVPPKAD